MKAYILADSAEPHLAFREVIMSSPLVKADTSITFPHLHDHPRMLMAQSLYISCVGLSFLVIGLAIYRNDWEVGKLIGGVVEIL